MEQEIENECNSCNLGDKRLLKRLNKIMVELSSSPNASIAASCGGWSDTIGAYRFLNNDKVTYSKILEGHRQSTENRIQPYEVILAVQDTTSIDLTGHRASDKLGYIENTSHRGIFVHPTIAVTPDRLNLGLIDAELWTRDMASIGKKKDRKNKDIEEKESNRWLNSYKSSNKLAKKYPEKLIVSIGDRESDIYELFELAMSEESQSKILLRAAQNRLLAMKDEETRLLWSALETAEELGEKDLTVTQTEKHKSRETKLSVKFKEVTLKAPYRKGKRLKDIKLNAVLAVEKNPPSESDKVEWLLLTTLEINNLEDALTAINYYSCRWQIEMFFRILKGGCQIEKIQLENVAPIENEIAIYMVISWRIQYLLMLGRQCPDLPANIVFSKEECEAICVAKGKPIPVNPSTLNEMIIMISMLGGYLNRKCDRPPGVKVFWIGLAKLADYAFMYSKMRKD